MEPPYAKAWAVLNSSGVAFGYRIERTGLSLTSQEASIIASCESTEQPKQQLMTVPSRKNLAKTHNPLPRRKLIALQTCLTYRYDRSARIEVSQICSRPKANPQFSEDQNSGKVGFDSEVIEQRSGTQHAKRKERFQRLYAETAPSDDSKQIV